MSRFVFSLTIVSFLIISVSVAQDNNQYHEAPMLDAQVQAGELPPVQERLPSEPLVVEPVEQVGKYGGTWRQIDTSEIDAGQFLGWTKLTIYEPLLRYERDASGFRANLVKSWEYNADATELTVHFREGIKWSDGIPFTVDDYLFWWNDIILDESFSMAIPDYANTGGSPMEVVRLDNYTLQFHFAAPNPLFLENSSRGIIALAPTVVPAHYLRQFHPRYNAEIAEPDALLDRFRNRLKYPDMPTLSPWLVVEISSGRVSMQRNPYYWKVDTAGNQLPYIDRLDINMLSGSSPDQIGELRLLQVISGNVDLQVREFSLDDIPLLRENEVAGNYRVKMWEAGNNSTPLLILHYDYFDEGINDLMYQREFRRALSLGINRNLINNLVAFGLGKPRQFAMLPYEPEFQADQEREFYIQWVNSFIEYDVATASSLLDSIKVIDYNNDGWRDRPDGAALELVIEIPSQDAISVNTMEIVKENWDALGLKTTLFMSAWDAYDSNLKERQVMISAWPRAAFGGLLNAAAHWVPVGGDRYSLGGPQLGLYFQSQGKSGVAPRSGSPLETMTELYKEAIITLDAQTRSELILDIYHLHFEEGPFAIGIIGEFPAPVVVKNNFHNVPEFGLTVGWNLAYPSTVDPEQFFISIP